MTLKRFITGERVRGLPVHTWDRFVDTVEREQEIVPADRTVAERSVMRVRIYNDTGEDVPAGGVIRLGDARFDPANRESVQFELPVINGELPIADAPIGIAQGPIPKQVLQDEESNIFPGVGRVAIRGYCWAKVNVVSAGDVSASAEDDNVNNLVTPGNIPIVWKPSGTGIKTCLINLSPSIWIRRATVTDGSGIVSGGSGEITYVGGATDTAWHDWFLGDGISNSRRVLVAKFLEDGAVRIIAAECEPEPAPAPPGHGNDINLTSESAGTTQGTAYGLSFNANRLTVVTATDNAVKLPATWEQGDDILIRNADASDSATVFPSSGDFINENAVNVGETLAAGSSVFYRLVESDHWIS